MFRHNPKLNFGIGSEGFEKEFSDYKKSKIVIIPVPFDITSTWIKGADKGPNAILDASPHLEFYDIETKSEVYKNGIYTEDPIISQDSVEMVEKVKKNVKNYLSEDKFVVTIGGDHSVSIGPIQAHGEKFKDFSVLHLDAHGDSRDEYHGNKYNHACVIARAKEITENVVSVGIRSIDSSERGSMDEKKVFFAYKINESENWIKDAVKQLSKNVYITIDMDVFDPSLVPATGTPEPGGLSWYQVINLLKEVAKNKNIVGFDVVELCPMENNKVSDFVAAKLIYQLLTYKFAFKKN
jgi:agmatinase